MRTSRNSVLPALAGLVLGCGPLLSAATFEETFAQDPAPRGWAIHGDPTLFQWDTAAQNLQVTWDSARPNTYFYRPLGTVLARDDDFSLSFDLQLKDIWATNFFEIAVGFIRLADATRPDFYRATGTDSPNLVEFDYFPDTGFGATLSPTFISSNSTFATSFNVSSPEVSREIEPGFTYHIHMQYTASDQTLLTTLARDGALLPALTNVVLEPDFSDFRVDALAVSSYSEAGQYPDYAGAILAHGFVDNLVITVPPPPIGELACNLANGRAELQFASRPGWIYTLESTGDFQSWTPGPSASGTGDPLVLRDDQSHPARFYRVRADRP